MPTKSRNYVFTLNNFTPADEQTIQAFADSPQCSYVVYGRETGESGTPHLQGYAELSGARTLAWVKRAISPRAHFEVRRGSSTEASTYCKKDGDFWEKGEARVRAGTRTDLNIIRDAIKEGKSELYVAENWFAQWVQYRRSFDAYRRLLLDTPRQWKSFVNVIWGTTGTGKTRFVYQQHPDDDVWVYPGKGWFDGYLGQRVCLFDDFRGDVPISLLLQLLDRYPLHVPVKGGHVNWNPRRIYITSNVMPTLWYDSLDISTQDALQRRFNRIDFVENTLF
mgnify:CR=1 FL=1